MLSWPNKSPSENLDYSIDWSKILPRGDEIRTAVWSVPEGLKKGDTQLVGATASVWIAGGKPNVVYMVNCRIKTVSGRVFDRSVRLVVSEGQ